jgi:enamine deaminase RidA (YjgF/YER057c/UK114 family)
MRKHFCLYVIVALLMFTGTAFAQSRGSTPDADEKPGRPNANLSSAIQVGNRLYIAGITGNTAANKGDVKAQAAESLARIERTIKAAGYDYNDMNASYVDKLVKDRPSRATIGAGLMGAGSDVEIMFTAVK